MYYDDPKSSIPSVAYNWIVNRGGPYFMDKIYQAALQLAKTSNRDERLNFWNRNENIISNKDTFETLNEINWNLVK